MPRLRSIRRVDARLSGLAESKIGIRQSGASFEVAPGAGIDKPIACVVARRRPNQLSNAEARPPSGVISLRKNRLGGK